MGTDEQSKTEEGQSRLTVGLGVKHADNCRHWDDAEFCTCGAAEREIIERIKKCLVAWRCVSCGHELLGLPNNPSGKCPRCGVESVCHSIFSDDREGLIEILMNTPNV